MPSLNDILHHDPDPTDFADWEKKIEAKDADEDISYLTILDKCGLDACLWCLYNLPGNEKVCYLFAAQIADRMKGNVTDQKTKDAVSVVADYANTTASKAELDTAKSDAFTAMKARNESPTWNLTEAATFDAINSAIAADPVCASISEGRIGSRDSHAAELAALLI